MKNLYLLKCKGDTDVIVDLNLVFTIRCIFDEKYIIAMDYTHKDSIAARFDDEKSMRNELANIISAMGGNAKFADDINFEDVSSKLKDRKEKMETMKNLMSALCNHRE